MRWAKKNRGASCGFFLGAEEQKLSSLITLNIFTMKMISQHKTTSKHPDYQ
jgi:hypothetical protein